MTRSWFDYGHGRLERLASEEQRSWLHGNNQLPSREQSLEPFNPNPSLNLTNYNNQHNDTHTQGQSTQQQFHRNSSLDNAVEDLLNNHFLSRAQRSESLATSNPEFCPISGRLTSNSIGGKLSSNQIAGGGSARHPSNQITSGNGRHPSNQLPITNGSHPSNQISSGNDRHFSNQITGGRGSANPITGGRHAANSLAGRLSSFGPMDLNPINDRMSSIGSLGDVNELLGNSAANANRPGGNSIHPSSESAVLYMEMLKNGYAPLFNDQSLPNGMNEPPPKAPPKPQPSAAEILMRHRLISLEARPEDLSRVPANLENLTNRLLENEKENNLIASTMASMMEHGNAKASETSKAVMKRMAGNLHHPGRKSSFFGSSDRTYMNEPDSQAIPSPRRQVAPRRFLSLNDNRERMGLPLGQIKTEPGHLPEDRSRLPPNGPYRTELNDVQGRDRILSLQSKSEAPRLPEGGLRLPNGGPRLPNEGSYRTDDASCSTAEASRSTAELLIQLNQGKLSSRTPSENKQPENNGWKQNPNPHPHPHLQQPRNDLPQYQGIVTSSSGLSSSSSPSRRPVQRRSFLSSNYVQDLQGPPPSTKSMAPPPKKTSTDPMVGQKRSATDMMQVKAESFESKAESPGSDATSAAANQGLKRFKPYHEDKWMENFHQLLKFKEEHGNCLVPHTYLPNPLLARWVKRQRRQYKLCLERCPQSTMTPERIEILNKEGFVWDSHEITWMRKFYDLIDYRKIHGHCRVPSCSKDHPQLATWVKCQRRQYRLKREGKSSAMTTQRIKLLDDVGFSWEVRFAAPAGNEGPPTTSHMGQIPTQTTSRI